MNTELAVLYTEVDWTNCCSDIVSDFSNMRWSLEIKIELKFHRL